MWGPQTIIECGARRLGVLMAKPALEKAGPPPLHSKSAIDFSKTLTLAKTVVST